VWSDLTLAALLACTGKGFDFSIAHTYKKQYLH
jgi:hypothetical protein